MKKLALFLVLFMLTGVIAGVYLFSDRPDDRTAVSSGAGTEAPDEPAVSKDLVAAASEDDSDEKDSDPARVAIAPTPQNLFPDAVEEVTARWVEGRVIFPEGAPDDDLLHVYSLSEFFEHDGFAERLFAIQHALREDVTRDPNEVEEMSIQRVSHALYARRPIAADGSFRVPVDPEAEEVFLMVEGRYLFTRVTEEIDLEAEAAVELELLAGAQLVVKVTTPEEADLAGTEVEMNIIATSTDQRDYDSALTFDTTVELFADATFELHAVPIDYGLQIDVKPEEWAASRVLAKELQAGETRRVEVELGRGGIVAGEVVDSEGAPVAGAQIEMMLRGNWFGFDDETVREGTTDELGRFEIARVTPGKLALKADHESFLESSRVSVEVLEGQTVEAKTLKLTPGNTLSGRVVNEAREAVSDVLVRAEFDRAFMAGPSAFNALRGAEGETRTDAEGLFTIPALGAGPFILQAILGLDAEGERIDPEDAEFLHYARQEKVYPKAKNLLLVLRPPIELRGLVTDGEENPVAPFTVVAIRESEGAMGVMPMETRTEEFESTTGEFTMSRMTEGSWKVQVRASGFITPEAVLVNLPRMASDPPLALKLVPTATVSGVVLGPTGESVPRATVRLSTEGPSWQTAFQGGDVAPTAEANESGNFVFADLPPGSLKLHAEAEGFASGASQLFELAAGDEVRDVELLLTRGGTLTGLAYSDEGSLVAGQFITLYNSEMEQVIGTTDGGGEFRFDNLTPGSWQVIGMNRQGDFGSDESGSMTGLDGVDVAQAEIVEGETVHVVLGAPPADPVQVHGKVTLDGEPYTGGIVTYFPQGKPLYDQMVIGQVDASGRYEITIDGPGSYFAIVQRMGRNQTQQQNVEFQVEIPAVTDHREDLELPLGRISGSITGPDGQPAVGARVTLAPAGGFRSDAAFGGQYAEVETDAAGQYDLVALRPGTYMIASGGAPLLNTGGEVALGRVIQDDIRLGEGEWKKGIDLQLSGPGNIEVRVLGADGQPARGASVFFRDGQGRVTEPFNFAMTDSVGMFTGRGLGVGDYTVSARVGNVASMKSPVIRITEGETAKVELRLEPGVILWIKLKDREKQDIRASLQVLDEDGHDWGAMFGIEDLQLLYGEGGFSPTEHRLGPLPPGKYKVIARGEDGKKASKPVRLKAGESERRVTVRLK